MFVFLSLLANAEIPSQSTPPIVNGNETDRFIQTGALMYSFPGYGVDVFCSGTLVHEKWVLTAAHCIDALDEYAGYGADMLFVMGDSLYSDEGIEQFDQIIFLKMHPDYNAQRLQHDIGVLELEEGFSDISPIAMNSQTPNEDWKSQDILYVGWGVTGDNRSDSGRKRMASINYHDYDEQFVYSIDDEGQKNLCSGDSGGSAFRIQADGSYVLVGVNSFVFAVTQNAVCRGGGSGATRVDSNMDWIREYVPEPEELDIDLAPIAACSSIPSSRLWSSFGLVLLSALVIRRRS